MAWTEEDDKIIGSAGEQPRSPWQLFKDSFLEGGLHNPIGAEGVVRATSNLSGSELSRRERIVSDSLAAKRAKDDAAFSHVDTLSPENIGRHAVEFLGNLIGGVDPTAVIAPGRSVATRIASQTGINAGLDVGAQLTEKKRGVRDEVDPREVAFNAGAGALTQGAFEVHSKAQTGRMINRGSKYPQYAALNDVIVNHLEGGGTLEHPKTSPKGAMGPQQVMPETARKPGFGIKPWDGKTQADLARVGRQYSAALLDHYKGDSEKALAAYNGGFGRVDHLVSKYGDDWLQHMPEESRNYVANGMDKMNPEIRQGQPIMEDFNFNPSDNVHQFPSEKLAELTPDELRDLEARRTPGDVVDFSAAKEQKDLEDFHDNLMSDVNKMANERRSAEQKFYDSGTLPFKKGDEFHTPKSKELGADPWKVVGHYIDPKDPEKYGYRVERGNKTDDTYESSIMLVSNPKMEPKMKEWTKDPSWTYKKAADRFEKVDHLTPSERQDMDASAPKPTNRNTGAEDVLGKGSVATTPVNDIRAETDPNYDRNNPPARPPYPGEEGFPKPGEPGNRGGPYGGDSGGRYEDDLDPEKRLTEFLRKKEHLNADQRKLYHEARSKTNAKLRQLQAQGGGRENFYKQLKAATGQLPRVDFKSFAEHFSDDDFRILADRINFSNSLLGYQKLSALKALNNLLGAEGAKMPTPSDMKLLSQVYSPEFIKALLDNRPFMEKFWHGVGSTLNIPRALMSSIDLSAPFRQGVGFVGRKAFWKAFIPMYKAAFSENSSRGILEDIKSHPNWEKAVEGGLSIVDPHSHYLADREEAFQSDFAEKIPGLGVLVKGSNRAYSGFLNKLRMDVFNDLLSKYEAAGLVPDTKKLKEIANFVNSFSGRGNLGKQGNAAAPALAAVLYSPRLIASRAQMLFSPITYLNTDPILRKEMWKSLLSYSAYVLATLGVAKYGMGMDVEDDPRSSDFAKIKTGNTRQEPTGGIQTYVRLAAEIITQSKMTGKGDIKDLAGGTHDAPSGPYDESIADVVGRFARSKESPLVSLVHDFWAGENIAGEPFYRTKDIAGVKVNEEIQERITSMTLNDLYDVYQDGGLQKTLEVTPLAAHGWGLQTYKPKAPKAKKSKDEFDFGDSFKEKSSKDLDKELGF